MDAHTRKTKSISTHIDHVIGKRTRVHARWQEPGVKNVGGKNVGEKIVGGKAGSHEVTSLSRVMMIPNQTLVTSLAQHVLTAQNTSHSWDAAPSPQGCISMVTADYPDDPISQAVEHWISKGKGAIILPVLFLLGTVGICLSLTSFYRQGLKHRINLCLFSLEFIHLLNIAFLFLLNIDSVFLPLDSGVYGPVYQFLVNHRLLGMLGFMYGAMYLTAVASCERCLTVLFPLQSKTLLSTRTMYVVIICGTCLTTLPFFVVTARYQVTCFFDVVKNSTVLKYTEPSSGKMFKKYFVVKNEKRKVAWS
ncbi:hypothetical protein C0Q70_18206 [Pomacea canaliculata]|uniref:G-protein coupled receptors family 1 profile domain-containing protein n=1 Tax=Pomacea canaliculata TaxID=400727 RepID=A0A2T7NMK0_POMCA|nr:hypothetical protein C0Q70_18206 [Pomacea canaliculata]